VKDEEQLLAIVNQPRRRAPKGVLWAVVLLVALGPVLGGGIAFLASDSTAVSMPDLPALPRLSGLPFVGGGAESQIETLALDLSNALRAGNIEAAVRLTAAGDSGDNAPAAAKAEEHRRTLRTLRSDLADAGCDWSAATPVAFGGILAQAASTGPEAEPEAVAVGYLYLASGLRVYAVEVSARQTEEAMRVVDIWNWQPVDVPPTAVRAHAMARVEAFEREELPAGSSRVALDDVEPVYLELTPAEDG
jgi:hypothetical protein